MNGVNPRIVLVVDDEVFARLFAVQIFLDQGFTVLEAADAEEGLEVLDANDDVGLLFTDISMPGDMDGLQLIARVRSERPGISFVATSGRVMPKGEMLPRSARFLPKPYTAHALMATIRELSGIPPVLNGFPAAMAG
ncbi:MAG TPA: response regulator [Allosphingosinicella sp.]|nr:response regulator [Allosphingosinicella sp.]